jgi:arylsulfatase
LKYLSSVTLSAVPAMLSTRLSPTRAARRSACATPAFNSSTATLHDALWFFHENNRAFRQGDWKIVADNQTRSWSLYNLKTDRAEQNDLAATEPERVKELAAHWQALADRFRDTALQGMPAPQSKPKGKGKSRPKKTAE